MLKGYSLTITKVVLLLMHFIDWTTPSASYENSRTGRNNHDHVGLKFPNKTIKLFSSYGVAKAGYVFFLQCPYFHIPHELSKRLFYCLINQRRVFIDATSKDFMHAMDNNLSQQETVHTCTYIFLIHKIVINTLYLQYLTYYA